MHSPPAARLVVLGFPDPFLAADDVPDILASEPIGLEGVDGMLLDFMRRKNLAVDDIKLLPEGGGFLLAEFGAETAKKPKRKARDLLSSASRLAGSPQAASTLPRKPRASGTCASPPWAQRSSFPASRTAGKAGKTPPLRPEQLGSLPAPAMGADEGYGYRSPMYGHFGQGCVHLRINFDLETRTGIRKFRDFLDQATDIVIAHGGSISGEHGDGQARGALLPKMFGPELMQAFREFKTLWDPDNRMNPGKMIDPIGARSISLTRICASAPAISRSSRRPSSSSPTITGPSAKPRCAASAWAPAAKTARAPCAPATWPRARRSTPPAAARTCSGRCCEGKVSRHRLAQ